MQLTIVYVVAKFSKQLFWMDPFSLYVVDLYMNLLIIHYLLPVHISNQYISTNTPELCDLLMLGIVSLCQ